MAEESMEKKFGINQKEKKNLAEKNLPGLLTLCPLIVLIRFISDETTAIGAFNNYVTLFWAIFDPLITLFNVTSTTLHNASITRPLTPSPLRVT